MKLFGDQYRGRRVLLTGHTGFKGSWLALWLTELGADIVGLALPSVTTPNHWDLLGLDIPQYIQDIRDKDAVSRIITEVQPEIVFHLSAQALVRQSYNDPLETWSTNVMGTANVLNGCRLVSSLRGIVVVTSDKCYENQEWLWGYREIDRLGGHDPYSASKAATELVVTSYRSSFYHEQGAPLFATARAGNVIGGGDWSEDRLIPDLVRAVGSGHLLEIRSPNATRPWQHVLGPLSGYLLLGQKLLEGRSDCAECWNFGPNSESNCTVAQVLQQLNKYWSKCSWQVSSHQQPHEANFLHLDSTKSRVGLGWKPIWTLNQALEATAAWYSEQSITGVLKSRSQISEYIKAAKSAGAVWCSG